MPKRRRNYCRKCGACRDNVPISRAGYCPTCSQNLHNDAVAQLKAKKGPVFDHYQAGLANARAPIGRPTTPYPPDA